MKKNELSDRGWQELSDNEARKITGGSAFTGEPGNITRTVLNGMAGGTPLLLGLSIFGIIRMISNTMMHTEAFSVNR